MLIAQPLLHSASHNQKAGNGLITPLVLRRNRSSPVLCYRFYYLTVIQISGAALLLLSYVLEVTVYNGGLIEKLFVNVGETLHVKLKVDKYVMISDADNPCTDEADYSANAVSKSFLSLSLNGLISLLLLI